MEGKLKDSAAARKAADQARMQAERRLAAEIQTAERLAAEVRALRDANELLELRVKRLEEQGTRAAGSLSEAEQSRRRLLAERDAERRRTAALEEQLGALSAERRRAEQTYQERLRAAQSTQAEQRARIAAQESELTRLAGELRTARSERGDQGGGFAAARPQAPVPETPDPASGGPQARAAAASAAAALRAAQDRSGDGRGNPAREALREIEQTLHRHQSAVARATGGRSVYRVRPGDTLALIASRWYGDHSRWQAIYEANRHVLPDPDRLISGMTLVIPRAGNPETAP